MLDEFPALGRLDFFETALAFMAGYGLKSFLIAQSLNQIEKAYGPNNAILDNCHVVLRCGGRNIIHRRRLWLSADGGDLPVHPRITYLDGKPTDEPILIWCEQGFGDNIMFARFMKNALEVAPNAFMETQPQLFELFQFSHISECGLYRRGRTLPGGLRPNKAWTWFVGGRSFHEMPTSLDRPAQPQIHV